MDVDTKTISPAVVPPPHEAPPRRPSALAGFARQASGEWRRIRQGFTRQNVISFAKAMAWVVPLTLLIWVYAETAQDVPKSNVQMLIELKSADSKFTVKLIKPADHFILCDLQGPSANLERFTDQLRPTDPLVIIINPLNLPLGENSMQTKTQIMDIQQLKSYGISVNKCEPDVLTFDVDQVGHRMATVIAPPGIATLKSVTFDPPTVTVSGPKHELDAGQVNGQLSVVADIASLSVLSSPGQHEVDVSLRPIDDLHYSTDKVKATLVVTDPDVPYTLPGGTVPVELTAPLNVLRDYAVTADPVYSAPIQLLTPPDKIPQLKQVYLELKISLDDVDNPRPMPLELRGLPDGVRVAPGQTLSESFTATRR